MVSYEPDSLEAPDAPHLLFGNDDDHAEHFDHYYPHVPEPPRGGGRRSRRDHAHHRRRRQHRHVVAGLALLVVLIVVVAGWFAVRPIVDSQLAAKDYTGVGTGEVRVTVKQGDDASAIAATLKQAGVVRTESAFTAAARANPDSVDIQPGVYRLRQHMSAAQALALLLDPSSRMVLKVSIPEGTTEKVVVGKLAQALGVPVASVANAANNVAALGLPDGYAQPSGAPPASAEGFLFPDTYNFDPGTNPSDALQQMISEFASKDRGINFAGTAKQVGLTPYQALIVASMIEAEAKFPEDRPKVARVILNRMAHNMPLGIDATSIYGAELAGQNPAKIDFDAPAPYNTRHSSKLPPTPIDSPGTAAMTAAVAPAAGPWLYYVNGDAAGHLAFFADQDQWAAAVKRCQVNHWGCS